MRKLILTTSVLLSLSGCTMYQPRVVDWKDPFTNVPSRTMSVGESDQSIFLSKWNPSYALARVPINQTIGMAISEGDTTMTYAKFLPERQYDVPADAFIRIKMLGDRNQPGDIVSLPVVRKYHTSNGSLVVVGRVNRRAFTMLERGVVDIVRVEPVVTNESDPGPIDWYPMREFAKAFQKGMPMLAGWQRGSSRPLRETPPPKPPKTVGKKKK